MVEEQVLPQFAALARALRRDDPPSEVARGRFGDAVRRLHEDPQERTRMTALAARVPASAQGEGSVSLTERLAAAQRDRVPPSGRGSPHPGRVRRSAPVDPFQELKREVHQALINNLGPKLYDSRLTQPELEQKVRQTLTEVLSAGEVPLTTPDRVRIAQEIADDILGTARSSRADHPPRP